MSNNIQNACPKMVERFIIEVTQYWAQSPGPNGLFEMRCLGENRSPIVQRFSTSASSDAVDFALRMNKAGLNIYMTINPVDENASINAGKGSSDENIVRAHYNFADADDPEGFEGLSQLCAKLKPDIVVVTGLAPHERRHAYWRLQEPCEDLAAWTAVQKTIALSCKTDTAVCNPSRIMRVPGTISFPPSRKKSRGYVTELVTLKEVW